MGLYQDHFRFDGIPPNLEDVRTEAHRRLGNISGIEALYVEGQIVVARSMLDPFTRPVVCAILQELGGQYVDFQGQPANAALPAWAHKPISEMGWRERMAVRYGWWAWFFGTAKPR